MAKTNRKKEIVGNYREIKIEHCWQHLSCDVSPGGNKILLLLFLSHSLPSSNKLVFVFLVIKKLTQNINVFNHNRLNKIRKKKKKIRREIILPTLLLASLSDSVDILHWLWPKGKIMLRNLKLDAAFYFLPSFQSPSFALTSLLITFNVKTLLLSNK